MDLQPTSIEYLELAVTADVALTMPAHVALLPDNTRPDADTTWHPAAWAGDPGRTRSCRLLLGGRASSLTDPGVVVRAGSWWPWLRLTDNPEVLVVKASARVQSR